MRLIDFNAPEPAPAPKRRKMAIPVLRSAFPPGARVLIDGQDAAIVRQAFPEGSTSFTPPRYKIDLVDGDRNVAVSWDRVGVEPLDRERLRAEIAEINAAVPGEIPERCPRHPPQGEADPSGSDVGRAVGVEGRARRPGDPPPPPPPPRGPPRAVLGIPLGAKTSLREVWGYLTRLAEREPERTAEILARRDAFFHGGAL